MKTSKTTKQDDVDTMKYMINDLLTYKPDDIDVLISYYNIPKHSERIYALFDIAIHNLNNVNTADMMVKFRNNVSVDVIDYAEDCLHEDTYTIGKNIGRGGYGSVYIAYKNEDKMKNKYVFKIQQIEGIDVLNDFWKENYLHEELNKYNIGPEIEDAWVCNYLYQVYHKNKNTSTKTKIGISVQEAWDGDAYDLLTTNNVFPIVILPFKSSNTPKSSILLEKVKNGFMNILKQVLTMHQLGYVHRDLKLLNVLYKYDNGDVKFTVADFGLSTRIHDIERNDIQYKNTLKIYKFFNMHYYRIFDKRIRDEAFLLFPYSSKIHDPRNLDYIFLYIIAKQFGIIKNKNDFDIMVKTHVVEDSDYSASSLSDYTDGSYEMDTDAEKKSCSIM